MTILVLYCINYFSECENIRKRDNAPSDGEIQQENYSDWKRRMLEGYEHVNNL